MAAPLSSIVRAALREDVGRGDATTLALVPAGARTRAAIVARHACVVCGTAVACEVFRRVDPRIRCTVKVRDGAAAKAGDTLIALDGPARGILTGERAALNFMQRMTGIATLTREFVRRGAPHRAAILDTRKTTPGLRALEKHAVACGGGTNHRFGLFDRVLIKDNHRAFWAGRQRRSLADAVRAARTRFPRLAVEIEVETEAELRDALAASPDWVLLDNMTPARLRRCVAINAGRAKLEASGGITLATVARVAATGVDAISVGALTHSAPAADLSLEFP
ncbi:MAG: carboxylating nicotinate-nucleotide diphosphorylase [Lentisphaerae bacterium]|nr:carboxylating nicotinate-nucleotide diphosphorylase [Lentisphaerota bacterium]